MLQFVHFYPEVIRKKCFMPNQLSFQYFLAIYKARQQWTTSRVVSNLLWRCS